LIATNGTTMTMHFTPLSWSAGLVLGVLAACVNSTTTENHCANQDGDAFCLREHDDRPYCGRGSCYGDVADGCLAMRPEDDACYSPCGGGLSLDEDPDCEGVADASSDDGPTTQPTDATEPTTDDPTTQGSMTNTGETETATDTESSTGPSGCTTSAECIDPANPICEDMECVPCTSASDGDTACADKDANAPACRDDGECVQCTSLNAAACEDTTPICDGPSSSCVGCTYHEQCEASACRIATGACFDTAEVYDVGAAQTYATINDAHDDLGDGAQVVLLLHEGASFDEMLDLTGANTAYAFLAADGGAPQWVNTNVDAPTLRVTGTAEAYVQDVRMTLNGSDVGIEVNGASAYLDRALLNQNTGGGLLLSNGADAHVRNCFVGGEADLFAVNAAAGTTLDILYSTIGGATGDASALQCGAADVTVRNSIVVSRGGDEFDIMCVVDMTYSVTENPYAGTGNENIGDLTSGNQDVWFTDYGAGEFFLNAPPAPILTAAQWQTGDPATDIESDARPDVDGTADVAGADIP